MPSWRGFEEGGLKRLEADAHLSLRSSAGTKFEKWEKKTGCMFVVGMCRQLIVDIALRGRKLSSERGC